MKTVFSYAVCTIAALGCFTFSRAQKIAHVNVDSLTAIMPETKIANEKVQMFLNDFIKLNLQMQQDYETKSREFKEKAAGMSADARRQKENELNALQADLDNSRSKYQALEQNAIAHCTAPLMEKMKKAVSAVAKEKGYKYVLDSRADASFILYCEDADNIFSAVKLKLAAMPAAVIPDLH